MTAYMGLTNLVKSGTVTVTSEASGFEKENAQSWKTSSWWKANAAGTVYFYVDMGAAVNVDCWGFVGSDLADNAGTIKPEYSATGAWAGEENDLDSVYTPTKKTSVFKKVTNRNARYFRFEIDSTGAASFFANLYLGIAKALSGGMPSPFSPANLNRDRKIMNNISEGGQFLGRILRSNGSKIRIPQKNVERTWIDANWDAIANHIELYPFYFLWNEENFPSEAAYCMAKKITYPKYQDNTFLMFDLDCTAIYDV
jgi:hypothetical protein